MDKFFDLRSALLRHFEIFERPVFKNEDLFLFQKIEVGNCAAARIDNGIATHARVARARPTGTCRRQSDAPCVHGLSAEGPRADGEEQGSRLESQREFEILAELNRAARE